MAAAYERADRFTAAIAQYDLWIAAHEDDERIPHALNSRCWARALDGGDASLALKDCNAALKRAKKGSSFYAQVADSRGLVLLRLGDYPKSIADYDASIAIAPKIAWSWYGRGIDKLPEAYRSVLLLREVEELSTVEVAAALGITQNAAKVRLHRARQALKTLIERERSVM